MISVDDGSQWNESFNYDAFLNERMKEHGTEYRKYSVQIIHLFKKTLKPL